MGQISAFVTAMLLFFMAADGLQPCYAQETQSLSKILSSEPMLEQYKKSINKNVSLVGENFENLPESDRQLLVQRINFNMVVLGNVASGCGFEWDQQHSRKIDITVSLIPIVDRTPKHLLSKLSDIYQLDKYNKLSLQGRIPSILSEIEKRGYARIYFGPEHVPDKQLEDLAIIWDWSAPTKFNKTSTLDFAMMSGLFGLPVGDSSPEEIGFSLLFNSSSISQLTGSDNERATKLCNAGNLIKSICLGQIEPNSGRHLTRLLSKINSGCSEPQAVKSLRDIEAKFIEFGGENEE